MWSRWNSKTGWGMEKQSAASATPELVENLWGDIINHDIVFKKLWEDNELIELEVTCSSPVITAKTHIIPC